MIFKNSRTGWPLNQILIFLSLVSTEEIKVWHGETDIATYSTDSGEWVVESTGEVYGLENMFDDEESSSIWHNHIDNTNTVQTLTFNFLKARDKTTFKA